MLSLVLLVSCLDLYVFYSTNGTLISTIEFARNIIRYMPIFTIQVNNLLSRSILTLRIEIALTNFITTLFNNNNTGFNIVNATLRAQYGT